MYEIQWFKLDANIFSNRKIKTILSLSDGDTYFRVRIQTIALAIECNNKGKLEFGEKKYQSIDKFEKQQKQNRERQRRYRENKKNNTKENNVTITLSNAKEKIIKNKENNKEKEREESENGFRKYKM